MGRHVGGPAAANSAAYAPRKRAWLIAALAIGLAAPPVARADEGPVEIQLIRPGGDFVALRLPRGLLLERTLWRNQVASLWIAFEWASLRALTAAEKRDIRNRAYAFVYLVSDLRTNAIGYSGITVWDVYRDTQAMMDGGLIAERRADLFLLDLREIERRKLAWFSPALSSVDPNCVFARDFFVPAEEYKGKGFDKVYIECGCSRRGLGGSAEELDRRCNLRGEYRAKLQLSLRLQRADADHWPQYLAGLDILLRPLIVER